MRTALPSILKLLVATTLFGYAALVTAYPWDQDMVDQPSEKPQRNPAPPGPGSVPVDGGESVPAPETDQGMFDAKEEAAALINPVPSTPESIATGKMLYTMNCAVCHGADGRGDGPVGLKMAEKAPVDLSDAYTQDQADGQIFFTLTRGRGLMPFYRDALSQRERWEVINYLRSEFGTP